MSISYSAAIISVQYQQKGMLAASSGAERLGLGSCGRAAGRRESEGAACHRCLRKKWPPLFTAIHIHIYSM